MRQTNGRSRQAMLIADESARALHGREEPPMADVHWKDQTAGAAKRVAHYLATEVGEGKKFKKGQLRRFAPDTEQVDRRMRDLRKVQWAIRNYRDKAGLKPDELYLEKIGQHIW